MPFSRSSIREHRPFLLAALAGAVATVLVMTSLSAAAPAQEASAPMLLASAGTPFQVQPAFYLEPGTQTAPLQATFVLLDAGPAAPVVAPPAAAAPSLTVPPDPIDNPGGALDSARAAWRDGGWLGVTLVGVYLLVLVAKRYVSWLETGRRAVVVAAFLTALVTAISTFTGGSPTLAWAINALVAGVLLYLRPETQPSKAVA